jgi:hypothetical protein
MTASLYQSGSARGSVVIADMPEDKSCWPH